MMRQVKELEEIARLDQLEEQRKRKETEYK